MPSKRRKQQSCFECGPGSLFLGMSAALVGGSFYYVKIMLRMSFDDFMTNGQAVLPAEAIAAPKVWRVPTPIEQGQAEQSLVADRTMSAEDRRLAADIVRWSSPLVPIKSASVPTNWVREKIGLKVQLQAKPLACRELFLTKPNVPPFSAKPPQFNELSPDLQHWYTQGGTVPIFDVFEQGDYHNAASKHRYGFSTAQFQRDTLNKLEKNCENLAQCQMDMSSNRDPYKCPFGYPSGGGHNVCRAAMAFGTEIRGKRGLVIGAQWPWVEGILFAAGAREIVTIEYANATSDRTGYSMLHPNELKRRFLTGEFEKEEKLFDFAVAFASVEHDGLGRYADPLNPTADLEAVAQAACLLKPGRPFFLGAAVLDDYLVWNAQRIYGHRRLSLLTAPFEVASVFGEQPFIDAKHPVVQDNPTQGGQPCKPQWACNHHVVIALRKPMAR